MADPKPTDVKPTKTQHTTVKEQAAPAASQPNNPAYKTQQFWLPIVAITAGIILLCLAFAAGHRSAMHDYDRGYHQPVITRGSMRDEGFSVPRGGMMYRDNESSNTRVSGVVTAVDGNTITVAGNGTTTKVTTSDNTTYSGSSQPAQVNDSIVAYGAKDAGGELVASSIRLVRQ